jgi:hypothetical protein
VQVEGDSGWTSVSEVSSAPGHFVPVAEREEQAGRGLGFRRLSAGLECAMTDNDKIINK